MSVALDILRTYRAPREILRQRVSGGPREDRAIAVLLAACLLMGVAQWPYMRRVAFESPELPQEGLVASALFGWLFIAPLVFYALSGLSHVVARLFGGGASWYEARMALFWALLASTPLWLLNGLTRGFVGPGVEADVTGALALAAFLIFWVVGLVDVERKSKAS